MSKKLCLAFALLLRAAIISMATAERVHLQINDHDSKEGFHVSLTGRNLHHDLHLVKVDNPQVLSSGVQIMTATDVDPATGTLKYETWIPTLAEIERSHAALYTDAKAGGAFHVRQDGDEMRLSGVVNGMSISHDGTGHVATVLDKDLLGHVSRLAPTSRSTLSQFPYVAELFIVCDKDFSDLFGQDQQRVMDYLTVYMWDINMRFRTLPSVSISFVVNGILLINSTAQQPFIEQSRNSNGQVDFPTVIPKYSSWIYQQLPSWTVRFDLAPLVINTTVVAPGGFGQDNSTCGLDFNAQIFNGVAVWNDGGDWDSVTIGAHELGHTLGAMHDDDVNYPGGCADRGYIMMANGASEEFQWFFSSCSNNAISTFVQSSAAGCLTRKDGTAAMDPGNVWPMAPTMDEQCKLRVGPTATIDPVQKTNCGQLNCQVTNADGSWNYHSVYPVDNTPCDAVLAIGNSTGTDNGRCFRGICRPNSYMFYNVGSNLCMRSSNVFTYSAPMEMYPCNWPVYSPPDRLAVLDINTNSSGLTLQNPYSYNDASEVGEACAVPSGTSDGNALFTDRCGDNSNPDFSWSFNGDASSNSGKFMLVHTASGRCAKAVSNTAGAQVLMLAACDNTDNYFMWSRWI